MEEGSGQLGASLAHRIAITVTRGPPWKQQISTVLQACPQHPQAAFKDCKCRSWNASRPGEGRGAGPRRAEQGGGPGRAGWGGWAYKVLAVPEAMQLSGPCWLGLSLEVFRSLLGSAGHWASEARGFRRERLPQFTPQLCQRARLPHGTPGRWARRRPGRGRQRRGPPLPELRRWTPRGSSVPILLTWKEFQAAAVVGGSASEPLYGWVARAGSLSLENECHC